MKIWLMRTHAYKYILARTNNKIEYVPHAHAYLGRNKERKVTVREREEKINGPVFWPLAQEILPLE